MLTSIQRFFSWLRSSLPRPQTCSTTELGPFGLDHAFAAFEQGDWLAELGLLGSQDKRPEVRALAARLLGWFQTPQALTALSQLLRDRDPSVQISAAASLLLQDAAARGREPAQR